jgi:HSP20 family protein
MFGLAPYDRRRNQMQPRDSNFFDMDRVLENFFNDSVFPGYFSRSGMMKVDIREEAGAYLLDAELPGVNKENVNIEIEDGRLTISVNQDEQVEDKQENFIRHERRSSSLCRSFDLDNIDSEKISAKMENGVLSLRLPKLEPEKQKSRKIDIG